MANAPGYRSRMKRACLLVACLFGCHDDTPGRANPDGGGSAAIDAPANSSPLVGTWNRANDPPPGSTTFPQLVFHADGTIRADVGGGFKDGIWSEPSAGRVRVSDPDGTDAVEVDYLIDGSRMGYNVFLPMGTPSGFVGTWVQTTRFDANPAIVQTLTVAADHTVMYTIGTASPISGTWAEEGSGFSFTTSFTSGHLRPVLTGLSSLNYDKQ